MGDRKEYAAFSIPRREIQPTKEPSPAEQTDRANPAPLADAKFAEIEYEPNLNRTSTAEKALRFFSSVTSAQPIEQRTIDPIREKFFEMRSMASDRPFARNDSELFYRQAKFMEDFTDDYGGDAKFSMYYPYYQHMGYDQLRTYFTWRAKARRGEILPTSVSYAFLYVYELLSGIGVDDPADGLNKLVAIWNEFLKYGPALENYMPQWIKDYHIYYELPQSFKDFIKEHNMQKYYSITLIFDDEADNYLELWNSISGYDVTRSKFYNEGNQQLLKECFDAVLDGIHEYCKSRNTGYEDLFIYSISRRTPWNPFKQALFHHKQNQPERQVNMPGHERYYCKNDRWSANLPIYYSNQKDFVGHVLKKTESCLRQAVNYKYKLAAELKTGYGSFREQTAKLEELDGVIEKTIADFHRNKNRTIVTVDHANLARIREEALGTQDKLIVPEHDADSADHFSNGAPPKAAGVCSTPHEDESELNTQTPPIQEENNAWQALKEALSETELQALSIILHNTADLKAFADENGIMMEVLIDSINEKASDYIGDNIMEMEDSINIYDDYGEEIARMLA